ncbi:MAG: flagellar hook-associated protein FlgK [Arcobacter sp.]|nr:flagellar hook-associated protein FlgK [Arcobacter sp.]
MLSTLNVSYTGLSAAKTAVENVSNNIANENTPGYKKRVVGLSEIGQVDSLFAARGVSVDGVYRVTSQYMYDKLISENTKSNYYDKLSDMLGSVEAIFKETETSGFSVNLSRYFQSIEDLRTNPNSEVYKSALKNQGSILVDSLQNLYSSIEKQQEFEKNELNVNVGKVNGLLKEIGEVNQKIEKFSATNDLLDKRDQLELELSKYVDIEVNGQSSGYYELKIGGQVAISNNTNVRTIEFLDEKSSQIDKFSFKDYDPATKTTTIIDSIKNDYDPTTRTVTSKNLDANDIVTYKLNNQVEVSVTIGESLTMDWNGDGTETTEPVTIDNITRALVHKINTNPDTKGLITAYNGDYALDSSGNKIINNSKDNYLRIESNFPGIENSFEARVSIEKRDNVDPSIVETDGRMVVYKSDIESREPENKVGIGIFGKEIPLKSGLIKAQIENLSSESPNNKFQVYLDKLDSLAQTLGDIADKYIKTGSDSYIYGEDASDSSMGDITFIGLFSGASVKTLKFDKNAVNELNQEKLDYLATIQWKTDLSFDGKGQDTSSTSGKTSLLEYFREVRVNVSADKESSNFLLDTQENIKLSLENSYNQLVKVDKDEEMLDLMKFQAAYTANAKIVTAIDEMIQTLLGLKK